MDFEFIVGSERYEIEMYATRGGTSFAAANVKLQDYGRLPVRYERKLHRLYALEKITESAFHSYVWEDFTATWWDQFQQDATDVGLGKVMSAGRSGGWLLLDEYSNSRVGALYELATVTCDHCNKTAPTHVGAPRQCLFGSTCWAFDEYDDIEYHEILDATTKLVTVATYLKRCTDNVRRYAPADFVYNQKFCIDNLWENYRASVNADRVLQAQTRSTKKGARSQDRRARRVAE